MASALLDSIPSMTLAEICRRLNIPAQEANNALQLLVERGLVSVERGAEGKKRYRVAKVPIEIEGEACVVDVAALTKELSNERGRRDS